MNAVLSRKTFHIRVSFVKEGYEDYPCFSFYDIEDFDYSGAEIKARKQFCESFGFQLKDTKAYTFNKQYEQNKFS